MVQPPPLPARRIAGLVAPLFSIPTTRSWGIGELTDVPALAAWMREARLGLLQILPLNEMAAWSESPYSALSAMAVDPIYLGLWALEDFTAIGGEAAMPSPWRDGLAAARASTRVDYRLVRRIKDEALRLAFSNFLARHWARNSPRAEALRAWAAAESWWLDDYALYRAIHARRAEESWTAWPGGLRSREPAPIAEARQSLAEEVLYRTYLQWIAALQWERAREDASPVRLFGDLPFMVDADSADVWARQDQFRFDASVGAPPDAFSADGQDWGLPACDWSAMARSGFEWIAARARRAAELYDGFRIDHVVGFYRTYTILNDKSARFFNPAEEADQLALGERLVGLFAASPVTVIAEDLGTVPDFVRASLGRMGVPGFRVFRWERHWHEPGRPFRDPSTYPPGSIATTGTHDAETLAEWWDAMTSDERTAIAGLAELGRRAGESGTALGDRFGPAIRDLILAMLFGSGSNLVLLPIQDVFGWRDRINIPATVSPANWTWRLPWPADRIDSIPDGAERARTLAVLADASGRSQDSSPAR